MKLYTEEQVREAIYMKDEIKYVTYTDDNIIDSLTPIKLPSDEEMVKILDPRSDEFAYGYYAAINMIEQQIKQQDK